MRATPVRRATRSVRRKLLLLAMIGIPAAVATGTAPASATGANAATNGRLAFVATEAGTTQVFTINPDGSGQTQVTHRPDGVGEYGLSWAPDGSSLLVALSANRDIIYTMRLDGSDLRRISPRCTGAASETTTPPSRGLARGSRSTARSDPSRTTTPQLTRSSRWTPTART